MTFPDPRSGPQGAGFTTRPVIQGYHGVVAAGHYLAAEIAMRVLNAGGNAVDAGVAAVFALTLLKPQSCGIGGECPILIWDGRGSARGTGTSHAGAGHTGHADGAAAGSRGTASAPNPVAINGQGTAPRRATIEWFRGQGYSMIPGDGLLAATVPATFDACIQAQLRYGRLGLRETLGPVVDLAEEGYAVYPAMAAALRRYHARFMAEWPSSADVFLDGGQPPAVGWRLRQPRWAATFRRIVDVSIRTGGSDREAGLRAGRDAYYRGSVAEAIDTFARSTEVRDATGGSHGGLLDATDLASFETRIERPATVRYRGVDVHKCGPWTQGPVFLQQLRLLEGFDLPRMGQNSAEYLHTVIESAKLAFADRERWYGDPEFSAVPMERLLSQEYASARRRLIEPNAASADFRPGDAEPGHPLAAVAPDPTAGNGDTTHVDVADAEGNLFSATPSGGWLESSPLVPALGFPLGTRAQVFNLDPGHPNALAPGKRPRTTLTPSLATRDGRPWLSFGTPGGDQQDQWTLQFFLNVVDFGMNLQAAIDAPLVHTLHFPSSFYPHETHPLRLVVEGRIDGAVRDNLAARGHEVVAIGDWESGEVTAVRFDPDTGLMEGAASPRAMAAYAIGR